VSESFAVDMAGLPDLMPVIAESPHPLVFATVSGAHAYGFPSADSDIDCAMHLLPVLDLVALRRPVQTITRMWDRGGVEMDLECAAVARKLPAFGFGGLSRWGAWWFSSVGDAGRG